MEESNEKMFSKFQHTQPSSSSVEGSCRYQFHKWYVRLAATIAVSFAVYSVLKLGVTKSILPLLASAGHLYLLPIIMKNEETLMTLRNMGQNLSDLKQNMCDWQMKNEKLKRTIRRLKTETTGLEQTEKELHMITGHAHQNIQALQNMVDEQKSLLRKLQEDRRGELMFILMSEIVKQDRDGNFKLDDSEVNGVIEGIRASGLFGVNEKLFKTAVRKHDRQIKGVCEICRSALSPQSEDHKVDEKNQIIWIK